MSDVCKNLNFDNKELYIDINKNIRKEYQENKVKNKNHKIKTDDSSFGFIIGFIIVILLICIIVYIFNNINIK